MKAKRQNQTHCLRCGECCRQGGPALHSRDLHLYRDGTLTRQVLITVRKGELVHHPLYDGVRPAGCELVKVKGKGSKWCCLFLDESSNGCTIYQHRPYACSVLKCWEPEELLALVERDTLSRFDLLDSDDPMLAVVEEYEQKFPCPDMKALAGWSAGDFQDNGKDLEKIINNDLSFRNQLVIDYSLGVDDELFLFGRPLFQQLRPLGFSVVQRQGGVRLLFDPTPDNRSK